MKKSFIAVLGLLLVLSFIAINMAVFLFSSSQIFDLTADQRYTLSASTQRWLNQNTQDIYIRLYQSSNLKQINPSLATYTTEVLKLLEQYQINSKHHLGIQIVDVKPFSIQETEAQNLGLKEIKNKNMSQSGYLGLVISDDAGNMRSIPFLNPERHAYLEQDISRILSNLDSSKRADIGILSPAFKIIPSDDAMDYTSPWPIAEVLSRDYDLTYINPTTGQIPITIDVLLVVNPIELSNVTLYAIDQFLMYGGKVIIFMDSLSEYMTTEKIAPPQMLSNSYLPLYLQHYGISYAPDKVIGDIHQARNAKVNGQNIRHPFWLEVASDYFAPHPLMQNITNIRLNSATPLSINPIEGPSTTILATSGNSGLEIDGAELSHHINGQPFQSITKTQGAYPLAVLLEGNFTSYFEEAYVSTINDLPYVSISLEKSSLLVIADSDILLAATWNDNQSASQEWYDMINNSGNVDFLFNSIDYMLGNAKTYSVAPKTNSLHTQNLVNIFSLQAHQTYRDQIDNLNLANEQNQTDSHELQRKLEYNELIPSLKVTQQMELLLRDKLRLQNLSQKINYKIQTQYHYLINRFIALSVLLSLCFIALMGAAHWWVQRHTAQQARGIIHAK